MSTHKSASDWGFPFVLSFGRTRKLFIRRRESVTYSSKLHTQMKVMVTFLMSKLTLKLRTAPELGESAIKIVLEQTRRGILTIRSNRGTSISSCTSTPSGEAASFWATSTRGACHKECLTAGPIRTHILSCSRPRNEVHQQVTILLQRIPLRTTDRRGRPLASQP